MQFFDSLATLPEGLLALENSHDVLDAALAQRVQTSAGVTLHFPKWTDGRAYSQAVLLRSRLRFAGPIVATGEVLADMLPLLRRCGFSAVQLRADQRLESAQRALGFFDSHYQTGTQVVAQQMAAHAPRLNAAQP
jgi:uncharacterized protein (DUF934 family)